MDGKHILFVVLLLAVLRSSEAADAMKFLAKGFLKVLDDCKKELNIGDGIITDFYHYWKLEYSLLQRETGCAIICMSKKLELLGDGGKIHHGNAKEFAKENGADEELATKMVAIIHDCEAKNEGIADNCSRVLEIAKCFRTDIHEIRWEPKLDVIVTELITENLD